MVNLYWYGKFDFWPIVHDVMLQCHVCRRTLVTLLAILRKATDFSLLITSLWESSWTDKSLLSIKFKCKLRIPFLNKISKTQPMRWLCKGINISKIKSFLDSSFKKTCTFKLVCVNFFWYESTDFCVHAHSMTMMSIACHTQITCRIWKCLMIFWLGRTKKESTIIYGLRTKKGINWQRHQKPTEHNGNRCTSSGTNLHTRRSGAVWFFGEWNGAVALQWNLSNNPCFLHADLLGHLIMYLFVKKMGADAERASTSLWSSTRAMRNPTTYNKLIFKIKYLLSFWFWQ